MPDSIRINVMYTTQETRYFAQYFTNAISVHENQTIFEKSINFFSNNLSKN